MNVYTKRNEIERKIEKIINKKFDAARFDPSVFLTSKSKDEEYQLQVAIFRYLFNLKNKNAKTYLWNELYIVIACCEENSINKEDFTKDENDFFEEMIKHRKEFVKKYGDRYTNRFNCNKLIKTLRLILKPYDDNLDKEYISYFLKNKDEYENFYGVEYNKEDLIRIARHNDGPFYFAILLKENNEFIGGIALNEINTARYNIEYFVKHEHRKRGYAFEAVKEVLKQAFENKLVSLRETIKYAAYKKTKAKIKCFYARVNEDNIASIKLLEKLGFEKDGIIKYDREIHRKFHNSLIFTKENKS